jgi:23S rRNA (cytosine1962-C5)-methyltransferase
MNDRRRLAQVILKEGREGPLLDGHPWVFKGAVQRLSGFERPGDPCEIVAADGRRLGYGTCNPEARILARLVSRREGPLRPQLLRQRLTDAVRWRAEQGLGDSCDLQTGRAPLGEPADPDDATDAYRLVNSEGDRLPGLVVDRYGQGICLQLLTAGMERWREEILATLDDLLAPAFVFERSDTPGRQEEGLEPRSGLLTGALPEPLVVRELGLQFIVDPARGHKTGFYLDQRENRLLAGLLAEGRCVLNAFCYTGAFSVHALAGGATEVISVDSSHEAVRLARENLARNGFAQAADMVRRENVFRILRPGRQRYDMIVLDPPKFAHGRAEVEAASRGYRELNRLALGHLAPGGLLFTFSCSQAMGILPFQQQVQAAAAEAGRETQVLRRLGAGPDHPWQLPHREGEYLKGLLLRVV